MDIVLPKPLTWIGTSKKDLMGFPDDVKDVMGYALYLAVYTVKFEGIIYVLHSFQKKSKKGIATPKPDIELIKQRLKYTENLYKRTLLSR